MIFRPDSVDKYLKTQANLIGFINSQKDVLHGECLGNFNVLVGDQVVIKYKKNKEIDSCIAGSIFAHLALRGWI